MNIKPITTITALPLALVLSASAFAATIENPLGTTVPNLHGTAAPDTITNYGTVTSQIIGNGVAGFGGNDAIFNYGTASLLIGSSNDLPDSSGGSNSILNAGTVNEIVGSFNWGINSSGGSNVITNLGMGGAIYGSYNVNFNASGGSNSLANSGSVVILAGSENFGPNSSGGFNTLINSGTVAAWMGGSENYGSNSSGGSNSLKNFGRVDIEMDGSWNSGPNSSGGSNTLINDGTVGVFICGSCNLGVGSSGGFNIITNTGTVGGAQPGAYGVPAGIIGSYNAGDGSSGGGNLIVNSGTVNGDIVGSWNIGAGSSSTGNTISNSGTVNGDIWGSRDEGPGAVGGDDTITNSGIVNGSIFGGTGNDTIIHVGGSSLGGVADGGPGSDELGFDNMGSLDGSLLGTVYLSFENLGIYGGRTSLTGTWDFSGGQATVYSGNLNLRSSLIADTLTIESGGVLSGTGRFSGRLVNYGTISPGNSIGTLHVSGSVAFMPGSVFLAEIRPGGASDRLTVNGPVSLRGGTVRTALSRSLYTDGRSWKIISATGGVSGRFSRLSYRDHSETVDLGLSYRSDGVLLEIDRTPYASFGLTPAGKAVGGTLDAIVPLAHGEMASFLTAMDFDMSRAQIGNALGALSPEMYAGFAAAGLRSAGVFDQATALHQNEFRQGKILGLASSPDEEAVSHGQWTVWTRALGDWSERDSDAGYLGYSQDLGGIVFGTDRQFADNLRMGVDLGYTDSDLDWDGTAHSGSLQGKHIGLYAGAEPGNFFFDASLGYSDFSADAVRSVAITGFSSLAGGEFDADAWAGRLEGGYTIAVKSWQFCPLASLSYAHLNQDGFSENGAGAFNLDIADTDSDSLAGTLGARFSGLITRGQWQHMPRVDLRWLHQFEDEGAVVTANFSGYPSAAFDVAGIAPVDDQGLLSLGLSSGYGRNLLLYLDYGVAVADGYDSQLISGGLSWKF